MFRIGTGWDIHRLVSSPEGKLIIGGICIESKVSPIAHSDGDVLLHALTDALLGATALRDIGSHFPDTDSHYKNADSLSLLKETVNIILSEYHDLEIQNIDCTVILQTPKLAPYIDSIRQNIAEALNIDKKAVSVKAKTAEKILGELGLGLAVEAQVSVLISI